MHGHLIQCRNSFSVLSSFFGFHISWHRELPHETCHGPLTRYVKLRVAHAPGMPGTFFLLPLVCDPDMHHGTCVTHVPWCMPGWLACSFIWSRWRGKRSRYSRRMRNLQCYVCGKRPMTTRPLIRAGLWKSLNFLSYLPFAMFWYIYG